MCQSLHTTVFGEADRLVQMQIRIFKIDKIGIFKKAMQEIICKKV